MRLVLALGVLFSSGTALAVGEPVGDFPTADERLGIMALNRARSDPATIKGPQSTVYAARPPVLWSYELSRSSRFHATNLLDTGVTLMHTSPCKLKTTVASASCDGSVSCACATAVPSSCSACANVAAINTCGTDTFTRIGYFTAGSTTDATGEIAAAGYADPLTTVDGWMDEPAGDDGHRTNILDVGITSNVMGYGHADGASGCYSPFDVSDSGQSPDPLPKLPTAAVSPTSGTGSLTFYATWNDPAHGAPASINVVVDGACTAMTRELGKDTLNATYKVAATVASGCHNYYILATDAVGGRFTYPTTGAVSVGSCSTKFVTTQPAAACDTMPPPPDDMAVGMHHHDLAGVDLRGADLAGIDDPMMSNPNTPMTIGGCGCEVGSRTSADAIPAVIFLLTALIVLRLRKA
jgi:hypothetical protein